MLSELYVRLDLGQCTTALALLCVWHRLLGTSRSGKAEDTGSGLPHQYKKPLITPFSFPRESQRMEKVSPAKVRVTSKPLFQLAALWLFHKLLSLLMLCSAFAPEFDKFLEERAKVADRLPTLSSSSAGTPISPAAASRHQKQAKEDDAMFAL